ncbi:MAG: 3-keto-5-aminohexanoate cleavage protein [Pirellulaceae bacterium]|nr:3-keto-5-aminohexanoate cleavage protein [Pirellulaceae bacterium]
MASKPNVIITCAVTGSIHTPTMSEYLPLTPAQIAEQAIDAAKAGAAIVHLHARDPDDYRPTPDEAVFRQFVPQIKEATDAIVNITTGGAHGMTVQERLSAALSLQPEMCSLNMGSMNFGLYQLLPRYKTWKYDWEPAQLEMTRDYIFRNTFKDIEYIVKQLGEGCGTRFEFECYDVGHLYNLAHFLDRGLVKPPLFVQTIFGILGGIGADSENLLHMRRIADKLFGDDYVWSILAAGRHQLSMCTMGANMGGNVRVGLEDNLYLSKGELAKSNAALVERMRSILEDLSMTIVTPNDVRERLDLKGAANVNF